MSPSRRFHFHSHSRRSLPPDHALSISLTVSISPSLSRSLTLTVSPPASLTLTLTLTSHFVEAVVVASLCLPGFLPASLGMLSIKLENLLNAASPVDHRGQTTSREPLPFPVLSPVRFLKPCMQGHPSAILLPGEERIHVRT
uniref:Uncharacterized protein n=1 Tax=Fagus sylvatica TaxID=28930 RepID=A0A2N9GJK9_FAGSY